MPCIRASRPGRASHAQRTVRFSQRQGRAARGRARPAARASRPPMRCSRIASPAARTSSRPSASPSGCRCTASPCCVSISPAWARSEGEFANTHFSSNVADLVAAADHLRKTKQRARHPDRPQPGRRGGAGGRAPIAEARAVVTIAAPFDPSHVIGLFKEQVAAIGEQGEVAGGACRPPVPHQARIPRRHRRAAASRNVWRRCARRCWFSIRRPTTSSASTTPRRFSCTPSIRKASSRSPAPTIC